jgi:hypothetical protein
MPNYNTNTDEFGNPVVWRVRVLIVNAFNHDDHTVIWCSEPFEYNVAQFLRDQIDNFVRSLTHPIFVPLRTTMIEDNPPRHRGANEIPGPFAMNA